MALSGAALFLFVIGHLLGNLQIFLGPEKLNAYGSFLQSNVEFIWAARIGLLLMVGLHIWAAIRLSIENKAARPVPYTDTKVVAASYASRTMLMSGQIIFCFIIYHLLHFTVQVPGINFAGRDFRTLHDLQQRHDVYQMMVLGFRQPLVTLFYLVGMALLALHLSHGVSSMFQSLGWKKKSYGPLLDQGARVIAVLIFLGYSSIPLAVLTGFLK